MAEMVQVTNTPLPTEGTLEITNEWAGQKWLPSNVAFCAYAAPRTTGTGEKAWHMAATVVSFALLIWGLYEQLKIFNMRYGIAKAYANIASDQWARFQQRYRPLEARLISEASGRGPVVPDHAAARARQTAFAAQSWALAADEHAYMAARYRVCPDRTGILDAARASSIDDMVNWGYREAEAHARALDDLRWNQRSELLNIGRGHAAVGAQFAGAADSMLQPLGEGARNLTLGMFQTIGYLYDRNMLSLPFAFTQSSNPGQLTGAENTLLQAEASRST
jgi:hypothetical protein